MLLDGLALLVTEGRAAAAPLVRRAAHAFAEEQIAVDEGLRWGAQAAGAALTMWDEESWYATLSRQLKSCREAGLLAHLVVYVNSMAQHLTWRGDFPAAA